MSSDINSRNAPWIKKSKTWRFWFIYSDGLFKNWTRKNTFQSQNLQPCVAFSLEMKYFSRLLVVVVELKSTGFHLALVFKASLFEVENGVKPCRICKTSWRIQTKLICCIEDFKVFPGNWTLVLCERNQSLSHKIFK